MKKVEDDEERKNREGEEEKENNQIWAVHYNILWTCNQTDIIILKRLDIKKLIARIKIDNCRRHKRPI